MLDDYTVIFADLSETEQYKSGIIVNTRAKLERMVREISVSSIIISKLQDKGKSQLLGSFTRIKPGIIYVSMVVDGYAVFINRESLDTLYSDDNIEDV